MVNISYSVRLLLLSAFCLAAGSVSAAGDGRYTAVFADGRRISGDDLSGWGQSPAQPVLEGQSLNDPKRPLRWFKNSKPPLWDASTCRGGYVEFVGGDRLIGQVTGLADLRGSVDPGRRYLRVQPVYSRDMPTGLGRSVIRVSESAVSRIVWTRQPYRAIRPSTIFLRSGGRVKFTSLRWYEGGVRVLLESGVRTIPVGELAELHMPSRDPWDAYCRELAILNPDPDESLFSIETSNGLVLTCCGGRFKSSQAGRRKPRRKHEPKDPVELWYHLVQPAWSADAIWVPFDTIATRTYFKAHQFPLSRLAPGKVVQKSLTGFQWRWRPGRNAQGGRLMVAGQTFVQGIGVHAHNELTLPLPDFARSFRTRVALDASAGAGGCARGLIYLDSTRGKPLYRSDLLVGSGRTLDTGALRLPSADSGRHKLILVADAAHANRPAGADPLDIRDTLDWIEPVLELDRNKLQAAVVSSVLNSVPAWKGWDVSLSGSKFVPLSSQWDASGTAAARFVHALDLAGRRLTLTSRTRIGPKQRWLKVRARQIGPPVNPGRIEVRIDGRLAAYLPVCRRGFDTPFLVPLDARQGKNVKLQIVFRPGSVNELIEWRSLALVDRKTQVDWRPLRTVSAESQRGVQLETKSDGSILAVRTSDDPMPRLDTYCIRTQTDLSRISAIRLEAMADPTLPRGGPGRAGRVGISQFRAATGPTVRNTIRGRYVRLSLPGRETYLHVSEVQVFAPPPSEPELLKSLQQPETPEKLASPKHKIADVLGVLKTPRARRSLDQRTLLQSYLDVVSVNIALGAKVSQSSSYVSLNADKAVDGELIGGYTHTDKEMAPWLLLDLGADRDIDRIVIWDRADGNGYSRMAGLLVELLDAKKNVVWTRTDEDPGAPVRELFDSDSREIRFSSVSSDLVEHDYPTLGASLNPTSSGWTVASRFGEPHAVEFTLANPVAVRDSGLDIKIKQAYEFSYPMSRFSDGFDRMHHSNAQRLATLGRFRLLATSDQLAQEVEPPPVVIRPYETFGAEKADTSAALASPHPLFEDSGRFDAVKSADRAKVKLISDDRHAGKKAVRIAPGGEYRMNLGRMISIRPQPAEGEFRYIRFAFRKYGAGGVSLELGHLRSDQHPCRYQAGRGTPVGPADQSVWRTDLPPEWIVLDRDMFGDFGRMDLTSLTVSCSGGAYAVLDHVYLARKYEDFKNLPPAPSPEATNLHARRVLASPILKKGFPAIVSVKVGDMQAGGVIVGDEGYVMTVGRLLVGAGKVASIRLADGRTVKGEIKGVYRSADVGLVKITDKGPWKGLEISDADSLPRGDLYVGFTFSRSFKEGKAPTSYITDVSEMGYWTYRCRYTEKDAVVGGPLLDAKGRVVGLHNQMVTGGGMQYSRMRSPLHEWRKLKRGEIWNSWLSGSGPMLGYYSAIRSGGCGVAKVYPNTPAAAAGMKAGDLITHIDGQYTSSFEAVGKALAHKDPGQEVTVTFKRGSQTFRKKIRLMRRRHYPK